MTAPERIWAWDETSRTCEEKGFREGEWTTEDCSEMRGAFIYIRKDVSDAAIAAARAEGVREGMLKAVDRIDLAEHDAEERDWRSGANAFAALAKAIRAEDALTKVARLGQEWDADTKAHEKEIAVWSENYAALERERDAAINLMTRAHKVLVNLDRISVDPVLDPLIDEMAALIFRAMQPRPSGYEAPEIRAAAEAQP